MQVDTILMSLKARDIIERGYFLKELPPPFGSETLANALPKLAAPKASTSRCLRYSYSKYSYLKRTLSIPNPAHMLPLAERVSEFWPEIVAHCQKSPWSRTTPIVGQQRSVEGRYELASLPEARAEVRAGARYVYRADVAKFYASVYTHAIPWALHTKSKAKKNRKYTKVNGMYGNLLDELSRSLQEGQTVGLPVGPDTSFVIAEVVLSAVDVLTTEKLGKKLPGLRYVDDYEIACNSLDEAEQVQHALQDALSEFELQLNAQKTGILELPDALDLAWVHELSTFDLGEPLNSRDSRLTRYFSRAFELTRKHPNEAVLKYAIQRLASSEPNRQSRMMQLLLLQAAALEPGSMPAALFIVQEQQKAGLKPDQHALTRALTEVIVRNAPLQYGGDVSWALWGAAVFGVKLPSLAVKALSRLTDPCAILLALHMESEGRFRAKLDRSQWNTLIDAHELWGSSWLVAYEATGQGWLGSSKSDPATTDSFFKSARSEGVRFYDPAAAKSIPPPTIHGTYGSTPKEPGLPTRVTKKRL